MLLHLDSKGAGAAQHEDDGAGHASRISQRGAAVGRRCNAQRVLPPEQGAHGAPEGGLHHLRTHAGWQREPCRQLTWQESTSRTACCMLFLHSQHVVQASEGQHHLISEWRRHMQQASRVGCCDARAE